MKNTIILKKIVLCFSLCVGTLAGHSQTSDWQTLFRSTDNSLNQGQGYTNDGNGAVLAWNEEPLIKSYLQMYEVYHDPYYLRKLVTHFDKINSYLKDWNSDGGWAWGTSNYTDELMLNPTFDLAGSNANVLTINPGFEIPDSMNPTLPAGWTRTGTSTEVYRSVLAEDHHAGTAGLVVKTNGRAWRHGIQSLKDIYAPGKTYLVSFWGKTNGKVRGRLGVYDRTTGTETLAEAFFSNSNWAEGRLTFTAPSDPGKNLQILCYVDNYKIPDGQVEFDDVRLSVAEPATAENWVSVKYPPETVRRLEKPDCLSQPACLEVIADGVGPAPAAEQALSHIVRGASYNVQLKGWGAGRVEILNGDSVIASQERHSTSWGDIKIFFTCPLSGNGSVKIRLMLDSNKMGTVARFDDVSLKMNAEYLVHQAVLLAPILRFVRLVREDPWLLPEFGEKSEAYLTLAVDKILPHWERDWREVGGRGFYVSNNQSFYGRPGDLTEFSLPHNQYLPMAEIFLDLWHLTGDIKYRQKAEKLGQGFKSFLKLGNGRSGPTYLWHYADNLFQDIFDPGLTAEDLNHANLDISAVLRMAEDNVVFTPEDMKTFARTLLEVIWDGNMNIPVMHSRVDGSDIVGHEVDYMYGMNEWIGLARYEAGVWPLVDRLYSGISWKNGSRLLTVSGLAKYDPNQIPLERTAPANVTAIPLSSTTVSVSWTPPTSPPMNINPGIENSNSTDPTLPDGWTRLGTSTQVFRSTALEDRRLGNAGMVVKTNGISWRQGIEDLSYNPGETYLLTFWGKTNGNVRGRVGIYDRTGGNTVVLKEYFFANSNWMPMYFRFTAPAASGRDLKLYCYFDNYKATNGIVRFDEIRVSKDSISPADYVLYQEGDEKTTVTASPVVVNGLTAGTAYSFTVVARDSSGNRSPQSFDATVRTMPAPSTVSSLEPFFPDSASWKTLDNARAYPSPFRPGRGAGEITFDQIPMETAVRIYTIDGRLVKTIVSNSNGVAPWNITNEDGQTVASGVYLAILEKDNNQKKMKIVIQK